MILPPCWLAGRPICWVGWAKAARAKERKRTSFIAETISYGSVKRRIRERRKAHLPEGVAAELVREAGAGHPLFGKSANALARAENRDDVLFEFEDAGRIRYAVVHLTWSHRREHAAEWPSTQMFDSLAHWIELMKADHED